MSHSGFDPNKQIRDPIKCQQSFFPTQGAKAVRSGRYGELALEAAFSAHKVKAYDDNPGFHNDTQLWSRKDKILVRQYVLDSGRIVDFVYKDFYRSISLPIECKQQMGNGTTDEKLSYTVKGLVRSGYGVFWLVLSGGGFRPRVIEDIRKEIMFLKDISGRLIFNEGPFLQRAVEKLVDLGEV
jgi:hypothetical protein